MGHNSSGSGIATSTVVTLTYEMILLSLMYIDCGTGKESSLHWHLKLGIGSCQNEQRHHGDERGTKH